MSARQRAGSGEGQRTSSRRAARDPDGRCGRARRLAVACARDIPRVARTDHVGARERRRSAPRVPPGRRLPADQRRPVDGRRELDAPHALCVPELCYDKLYDCTAAAEAEAGLEQRVTLPPHRDLVTNHVLFGDAALAHASECRARIGEERWKAFSSDVAYFANARTVEAWNRVL